jgi:hypothetical protein
MTTIATHFKLKAKPPKEDIVQFVKYLYNGIKKFGMTRIELKLRELYVATSNNTHNLVKNKIFEEVSMAYGIAPKTILHSNKRGNITQAKVMAIILCHRHLEVTQAQIAHMFGHTPPIISARIKSFKSITRDGKPLYESEKRFEKVYSTDFMKKYENVDARVTEFIGADKKPPIDFKKW